MAPVEIQTFIFMDFGCEKGKPYKLTEVGLLAVNRSQYLQPENIAQPPTKKLLKLRGIPNRFDLNAFNEINKFIKKQPEPVCLISHNGHNFDFPILKRKLQELGVRLSRDILCADSLYIFYDIGKTRPKSQRQHYAVSDESEEQDTDTDEEESTNPSTSNVNHTVDELSDLLNNMQVKKDSQGNELKEEVVEENIKSQNEETSENIKPPNEETPENTKPLKEEILENTKPLKEETPENTKPLKEETPENTKPLKEETSENTKSLKEETPENTKPLKEETSENTKPLKEETPENTKLLNEETPENQKLGANNEPIENVRQKLHSKPSPGKSKRNFNESYKYRGEAVRTIFYGRDTTPPKGYYKLGVIYDREVKNPPVKHHPPANDVYMQFRISHKFGKRFLDWTDQIQYKFSKVEAKEVVIRT